MKCFLAGQHEPLQPWSYSALTMNVGRFIEPARPVEVGLVILTSSMYIASVSVLLQLMTDTHFELQAHHT